MENKWKRNWKIPFIFAKGRKTAREKTNSCLVMENFLYNVMSFGQETYSTLVLHVYTIGLWLRTVTNSDRLSQNYGERKRIQIW